MNTIRFTMAAAAILFALPAASQAQGRGGGRNINPGVSASARANAIAATRASYGARGYRGGGYRYGGNHRYWHRGGRYYVYGNPYYFGYPFGYPYYYGPGFGFSYYPDGYYYGRGYYGDDVPNGRIVDESGSGRGRGDSGAQSSLAAAVQRELKNRGFYRGPVDGQFGSASRSALLNFQRKQGLPASGRLDEKTLDALDFERR